MTHYSSELVNLWPPFLECNLLLAVSIHDQSLKDQNLLTHSYQLYGKNIWTRDSFTLCQVRWNYFGIARHKCGTWKWRIQDIFSKKSYKIKSVIYWKSFSCPKDSLSRSKYLIIMLRSLKHEQNFPHTHGKKVRQ